MVNGKGYAAKEGIVYDIENDAWEEMPDGMLTGWKGSASAMDEQTLYVVGESKGVLRKYDADNDGWEEIMGVESLRGADQITAAGGRVCVICGGTGIVVMDVVASPARLWKLETPMGFQAVAFISCPA